ncbi:MAG TPA: glycosyltransferase [Patescibacteria group bacterium]
MTINIISESVFFPKRFGGIHTAFLNNIKMFQADKEIKVVVNSWQKTEITHVHSLWPFGVLMLITHKPSIISSHILPETFIGSYKGGSLLQIFMKYYLRFAYNRASLVIALTEKAKEQLRSLGVTSRIEIVPNPVNPEVFHKDNKLREAGRKEYNLDPEQFVVLGAGNIIPRKGIEDFIEVAKLFPNMIFIWVGGKPFLNAISATINMQQVLKEIPSNIIFVEQVVYEKMPLIYNLADAFFFPSHQEVAPMSVIEAAACGLPLLLRDLPEYRSLYQTGYCSGSEIKEFAANIEKLQKNKTFYAEKSKASYELAQKFSYETIKNKLLNLYQSLLHHV